MRTRPVLLIGAVLVAAAAAAVAVWALRSVFQTASTQVTVQSPGGVSGRRSVEPGGIAPPFEIPGYDGRPLRLEAFRGHPVVLNLWASWCVPCRQEARTLEAAYEKYRGRGVVFVGVDLQSDTWGESRAFLKRYGITYPQGRDESGAVGRAYRVTGVPTTYFIGPDGVIRKPGLAGGFLGDAGVRQLADEIEQLLQNSPSR